MRYQTDRDLESYQEAIDLIKSKGYNLKYVSQMYLEDTYVFETTNEANDAYHEFERARSNDWIGILSGWWYSEEDFFKEVEKYEEERDSVKIKYYKI